MNDQRLAVLAGQALRELLAGVPDGDGLPEGEAFGKLQSVLERLVPALVGWRHESLDGFRFAVAKKVCPHDAELLGLCLLISDQTWTPIHLRLSVAPGDDALRVEECHLGEADDATGEMVRLPYDSNRVTKELMALPTRFQSVSWVHTTHLRAQESS